MYQQSSSIIIEGNDVTIFVAGGFLLLLLAEGLYIYVLRKNKNDDESQGNFQRFQYMVSVVGIIASFIPYGVAQEKMYTHTKVLGSNFEITIFLVCSASIISTAVSFSAWMSYGCCQGLNFHDLKATALPGIASGMYLLASFEALKHLVYPTAMLAFACTLIPLANLETIRQGHSVGIRDCVTAILVGAGLLVLRSDEGLLTWGDGGDAKYGTALLCVAMVMKAMARIKQDELKRKLKISIPLQALYTDTWALITVSAVLILPGLKLDGGIALWQKDSSFRQSVMVMCFSRGIGQLFEHYCIWHFNSIVATAIGCGRKLISILVSLCLFGYTITLPQLCGGLLIFIGITIELALNCYGREDNKRAKVPYEHANVAANGNNTAIPTHANE